MKLNSPALAKAAAQELLNKYPQHKTVEDVIDAAKNDNYFDNENDMLIVWGRLMRVLPTKVRA